MTKLEFVGCFLDQAAMALLLIQLLLKLNFGLPHSEFGAVLGIILQEFVRVLPFEISFQKCKKAFDGARLSRHFVLLVLS